MTDTLQRYRIDKDFYINLAQKNGASAAITQLHKETEKLENESFEGTKGYQPELVAYLNEVREFSRELWQLSLEKNI